MWPWLEIVLKSAATDITKLTAMASMVSHPADLPRASSPWSGLDFDRA